MDSSVIYNCIFCISLRESEGCSETICLIDTAPIQTFPPQSALKTFFDPTNPPCHPGMALHPERPRKVSIFPSVCRLLCQHWLSFHIISLCLPFIHLLIRLNILSVFFSLLIQFSWNGRSALSASSASCQEVSPPDEGGH